MTRDLQDISADEQDRKQSQQQALIRDMIDTRGKMEYAEICRQINESDRTTCPFCELYSARRYEHTQIGNSIDPPAPVTAEERVQLISAGFKDNVGLFSHLKEAHSEITSPIFQKDSILADHRNRLSEKDRLVSILRHDTEEQLLQIAVVAKIHPRQQLAQVVQEIFDAEREYPFLREERKKYEAEKNNNSRW